MKNERNYLLDYGIIPLALLGWIIAFHFGLMQKGYLRWDDSLVVLQAVKYPFLDYFYSPTAYRTMGSYFFTPWVMLAFSIDYLFFKFNFTAYYVHHLLSIWSVGLATFYFLRLWISRTSSLCITLIFLVGAPVAVVAQQLMTIHYVEGLVFCIVALYLFLIAKETGSGKHAWGGALFYLLAMTCKEVFVPLFGLLFCLSWGELKWKRKVLAPFGVCLILYTIWRCYMLGLAGGYFIDIPGVAELIKNLFKMFPQLFGGGALGIASLVIYGVLCGYFLFTLVQRRLFKCLFIVATSFVLIVGPLVPLRLTFETMHLRIVFLFWWGVIVLFAFAIENVFKRGALLGGKKFIPVYLGVLILLGLSVMLNSNKELDKIIPYITEFDIQNRYVFETREKEIIVLSDFLYGEFYYSNDGVGRLRKYKEDTAGDPIVFTDEIILKNNFNDTVDRHWVKFDQSSVQKFVKQDISTADLLQKWSQKLREEELTVAISIKNQTMTWDYGPYTDGMFSIVLIDGDGRPFGRYNVPPKGKTRVFSPFSLYVRYDSPDGWITYSPLLKCELDNDVLFTRGKKK